MLDDARPIRMARSTPGLSYVFEPADPVPSSSSTLQQQQPPAKQRIVRGTPVAAADTECVLVYDPATAAFVLHPLAAVVRLSASRESVNAEHSDAPVDHSDAVLDSADDEVSPPPVVVVTEPVKKTAKTARGKKVAEDADDDTAPKKPRAKKKKKAAAAPTPDIIELDMDPAPVPAKKPRKTNTKKTAPVVQIAPEPIALPPSHIAVEPVVAPVVPLLQLNSGAAVLGDSNDESDIEGLDELANALEDSLEEDSDEEMPAPDPPAPAADVLPRPAVALKAPPKPAPLNDDPDDDDDMVPGSASDASDDDELPNAVTIVETQSKPPWRAGAGGDAFPGPPAAHAAGAGPISLKGYLSRRTRGQDEEELLSSSDED